MQFGPLLCLLIVLYCFLTVNSVNYPILVGNLPLIIILLISIGYFIYDLYPTDTTDFYALASQWNITSPRMTPAQLLGSCGSFIVLGGTNLLGQNTVMQRTYTNLPTHSYISFILRAININQWNSTSDTISIYIDGTQTHTLKPKSDCSATYQGVCGNAGKDFIWYDVVGVMPHTANSVTVKYVMSNAGYANASYGIHNINILFRQQAGYQTNRMCVGEPNSLSPPCYADGNHYYVTDYSSQGSCDLQCNTCFGPGPTNCFGCGESSYFNGTHCKMCDSSCSSCSGSNANQCTICWDGDFLQSDNNTCTQNCTFPYAIDGTGNFRVCYSPCNSSQYIFYDPATNTTTCKPNCTSPYTIVDIHSNTSQCILCQSTQYRSFNTTGDLYCANNCTAPYFVKNTSYCLLCDFGTYISYNTSGQLVCVTNCTAPYKVMNKIYCLICPLGQYIQYNSTGQPTCVTNCTAPYQLMNNNMYCLICPLGQYISYDNSGQPVCVTNCIAPYQLMNNNKYCLLCPLGQYISHNSSGSLTCVNNCTAPYQVMGNNIYCLICPAGQFISYNSSGQLNCISSCIMPYQVMNNSKYCLICSLDQYITFNTTTGQTYCAGNCTSPYYVKNRLYCINSESELPKVASEDISSMPATILNALGQAETIDIAIASFLGSSNPATTMIAAVFKILSYIKYIRVQYPVRLQRMLDSIASSLITFNFAPPIPDSISNQFEQRDIPSNFAKYQLASSFLVNYWQIMITLSLILAIVLVLSIMEFFTRFYKDMSRLMKQIVLVVRWNFFLITFCGNFDQVILYSSLDLRTLNMHSFSALLSLLICLFFVAATVYTFGLMLYVVREVRTAVSQAKITPVDQEGNQNQNELQLNAVVMRHKAFQLFFKGYKDDHPIQKYFMMIYSLRLCLFYATIAFLFDYPLVQSFILLFLGMAMLAFIIKMKPFESGLVSYQFHVDEIGIFITNVCLVTLALLDHYGNFGCTGTRDILGDVIIYTNIAVSVSDNGCTVAYIVLGIKNAYENTKKYKSLGIVSWLVILVSPYESAGMDVDLVPIHQQQEQEQKNQRSKQSKRKVAPLQIQTPLKEVGAQSGIMITAADTPNSNRQTKTLTSLTGALSPDIKDLRDKNHIKKGFQRSIAVEEASSVNSIELAPASLLSPMDSPGREFSRRKLIRQDFRRQEVAMDEIESPRSLIINPESSRIDLQIGSSRRQLLKEEFHSAGLMSLTRNTSETRSPLKTKNPSNFRHLRDASVL